MSLLARIVEKKRDDVRDIKAQGGVFTDTLAEAWATPARQRAPLDVPESLRRHAGAPLRLIAEIKFKSPSAGELSRALNAAERAKAYAEAGAAMVSVLTDRHFFDGSYTHLMTAAAALAKTKVPLLAKEFVIDPVQVVAAARSGADAVLVIARIVDRAAMKDILAACADERIEPLVEVFTDAELDRALAAGARVVGVNARDLDTLAIDHARAEAVLAKAPASVVALHLSGVKSPSDVRTIARTQVHGALIGEALMRQDDPRPLLQELVAASQVMN